jgi:hypothetical protein
VSTQPELHYCPRHAVIYLHRCYACDAIDNPNLTHQEWLRVQAAKIDEQAKLNRYKMDAGEAAGVPPASATQPPPVVGAGLPHAKATFERAHTLIGGDRHDAYGDYSGEAAYLADMWNAIIKGGHIQPRHVPLMMIALKVLRESNRHSPDNMVDACGYAGLSAELEATNPSTPK